MTGSSMRRLACVSLAAWLLVSSISAGASAKAAANADKKVESAPRYCVVFTGVGSRIPKRVCQTREQWLREGFDPLAKEE